MEGLYFHCTLSVCVCVCLCVCVCPAILLNNIPAERMNRFGRGFRQMVAYCTGLNPIEIGDLGSNSVCSSDIPLVDLCLNLIKIEWAMTSL